MNGGGGAAGLAALRVFVDRPELKGPNAPWEIHAFEARKDIGGMWMNEDPGESVVYSGYDDPVPPTPLYNSLTTMGPHPIMAFHDFLFPPSTSLFPPASHVLDYLRAYADHFDLRRHIRFLTSVESLRWNTEISKWELIAVEGDKDKRPVKGLYDAMIFANGSYRKPRLPSIPGIGEWEGTGRKFTHAVSYREPSPFRGLNVLVVGAGPTGMDISNELTQTARVVYRSAPGASRTDEGAILMRGRVIALHPEDNRVDYEDGTSDTGIEHIIFATGYTFSFPSMEGLVPDANPPSGLSTSHIYPLARHIFPLRDYSPRTLAFVGLPTLLVPFPTFEDQSQAIATIFLNGDKLDRAAEEAKISERYNILHKRSKSKLSYIAEQWHRFRHGDPELEDQFEYRRELLALAGKKGWEVQSWEAQVWGDTPVMRKEWAKLVKSGVSEDWVRGVGEKGVGEWVELMHKVVQHAKQQH
ncbi:hypothetical protein BS47DRAFT_1339115 [Hydnum rufescens UP504]|uniref:FAD/NAD(P)-binding domain-containing protein n=1 Tax=Hydnum rufescens UP504 TaxID=1448309 RepID=A0A9P6B5U8_9AGAM|nr:hypothetical protein BS47DRAFT_1339115 [Hydnum rufescens UP504]